MTDSPTAAAIRRELDRLADDSTLARITRLDHIVSLARMAHQTAIAGARADGVSWTDIGHAIGTTKQAAQQRFGQAGQGASAARADVEEATLDAPESRPKRQSTQGRRSEAPEVLQGNRADVRRQQRAARRS